MSVSLLWCPVNPMKGKYFASGSTLYSYMQEAFGVFPLTLVTEDIRTLEGIKACGYPDLEKLISAIQKEEVVEVTAEF